MKKGSRHQEIIKLGAEINKIETKGIFPNSFYEATVTLTLNAQKS